VLPLSHLTSCTPTQSNLYLTNYLATVVSDPGVYSLLTFQAPNLMSLFHCLGCTKGSVQVKDNYNMVTVHSEELLALHPTKLEDHPLSVVCECLFHIFAANLHNGGCFSNCNLRMHHAMVTGTHLLKEKMLRVSYC